MITFPDYIGSSNIPVMTELCDSILSSDEKNIECDASELNFIDPLGLCMLSATCFKISSLDKTIIIHNLSDTLQSYCSRMDLFKDCKENIAVENNRNDRRDSLVEIKRLDDQRGIDALSSSIANAIVGTMPDIDTDGEPDEMTGYKPHEHLTTPIQYIFSELLQNALTHGRRSGFSDTNVWVAAQFFPKKNIIRLAVVDNGCGYLNTLHKHHNLVSNDDEGAIRTALKPKTSCNNDVGLMGDSINQGIGLTVVHDMTLEADGRISIFTGNSTIRIQKNREFVHKTTDWQGASISIEMNRDALKALSIHGVIGSYKKDSEVAGIRFSD